METETQLRQELESFIQSGDVEGAAQSAAKLAKLEAFKAGAEPVRPLRPPRPLSTNPSIKPVKNNNIVPIDAIPTPFLVSEKGNVNPPNKRYQNHQTENLQGNPKTYSRPQPPPPLMHVQQNEIPQREIPQLERPQSERAPDHNNNTFNNQRPLSFRTLPQSAIEAIQKKKEIMMKKREESKKKREQEKIMYTTFETRLQSYEGWPHQKPSAEECATAGLYFSPKTYMPDRVKCYACNFKYNNWRAGDNPKMEHWRWRPGCREVATWNEMGDPFQGFKEFFQESAQKLMEGVHIVKDSIANVAAKSRRSRRTDNEGSRSRSQSNAGMTADVPSKSLPKRERLEKINQAIQATEGTISQLYTDLNANPAMQNQIMQEIEQQNKFLVTLQQEKNKTEIEIQEFRDWIDNVTGIKPKNQTNQTHQTYQTNQYYDQDYTEDWQDEESDYSYDVYGEGESEYDQSWQQYVDENGATYWYNDLTGESAWE